MTYIISDIQKLTYTAPDFSTQYFKWNSTSSRSSLLHARLFRDSKHIIGGVRSLAHAELRRRVVSEPSNWRISADGLFLRTSWTFEVNIRIIWLYIKSNCLCMTTSGSSVLYTQTRYRDCLMLTIIRFFPARIHFRLSPESSTIEITACKSPNVVTRSCSSPILEKMGFPDELKMNIFFFPISQPVSFE